MDGTKTPTSPPINPTRLTPSPPSHAEPKQSSSGTDVLGIVSLVMIVVSPFIGLIVGILGERIAKKEGRSYTLSRIGWIINLVLNILAGLVILFFLITINSL